MGGVSLIGRYEIVCGYSGLSDTRVPYNLNTLLYHNFACWLANLWEDPVFRQIHFQTHLGFEHAKTRIDFQ